MKYFEVLIIVIFFLGSLGWFGFILRRMRNDYVFKLLSREIFRLQEKQGGRSFFSSQAARQLAKRAAKNRKEIIADLKNGNIEVLAQTADKLGTADKAAWSEIICPGCGRQELETAAPDKKEDGILLMLAAMYAASGENRKTALILDRLRGQKLSVYLRGVKAYLSAIPEVEDGNLQTAAEKNQAAVRFFRQAGASYEEAQAFMANGTIFRVAGAADTAQFMLEAAQKIFQNIGAFIKEAEAWGNLGMLMVMQERFDEAADRFEAAKALYAQTGNQSGLADILNQEALAELIRKNIPAAKEAAQKALSIHLHASNFNGEGLSREISGQAAMAENDWEKAISDARLAQAAYRKAQNTSAEFESLFLEAQGLFEAERLSEAEEILRGLVSQCLEQRSCFHAANAYNLLGRIFMQKNDLKRARGFFQQSLDCELKNERTDGIAIDYANIALVELQRGQAEQARQTALKALEFAKVCGNSSLARELQEKFNKSQCGLLSADEEKPE